MNWQILSPFFNLWNLSQNPFFVNSSFFNFNYKTFKINILLKAFLSWKIFSSG